MIHTRTLLCSMMCLWLINVIQWYYCFVFALLDSGGRHAFLAEGKDTFQIQDELGKDNYHFTLSEALIAVMEEVFRIITCE